MSHQLHNLILEGLWYARMFVMNKLGDANLPGYVQLEQVVKTHGSTLADINWDMPWGYQAPGCMAVSD